MLNWLRTKLRVWLGVEALCAENDSHIRSHGFIHDAIVDQGKSFQKQLGQHETAIGCMGNRVGALEDAIPKGCRMPTVGNYTDLDKRVSAIESRHNSAAALLHECEPLVLSEEFKDSLQKTLHNKKMGPRRTVKSAPKKPRRKAKKGSR